MPISLLARIPDPDVLLSSLCAAAFCGEGCDGTCAASGLTQAKAITDAIQVFEFFIAYHVSLVEVYSARAELLDARRLRSQLPYHQIRSLRFEEE